MESDGSCTSCYQPRAFANQAPSSLKFDSFAQCSFGISSTSLQKSAQRSLACQELECSSCPE